MAALAVTQGCDSGSGTPANEVTNPPVLSDTTAPPVPENLQATAASATRIDLNWSAVTDSGSSGLAGYRIYRDGSSSPLATVAATATTYSDTAVNAATQYSYAVRAFDNAGNQSGLSITAAVATSAASGGLDSRPANTTCLAGAPPTNGAVISLAPFTGLTFNMALAMLQAPADNEHWYVVEQAGLVKRFSATTPTATTNFIDLRARVTVGSEAGLLGMAFHPDFPTDRRVFLSYTLRVGNQLLSRIASFISNDGGVTLDPASESVLLTLNQPEDNHNGGNIAFGPDGFLYVGFGDGGGGGDAHGTTGNGQRLTTLLGKLLRIDIDATAPYGIPSDNPFANNTRCGAAARATGECPEIYAWGLRNPWRWSFDRSTGELWLADVGQNQWEEVDKVTLGGNYGWRCREGAHDFNAATPGCASAPLIEPVAEYDHTIGNSITGGYVYRGPQNTVLRGRYLFGDFGSGRIFAWLPENATTDAPRRATQLLDSSLNVASFGQGNDGELYVVGYDSLHRIVFQAPAANNTVAEKLSETGCVTATDVALPATGLIPYEVNAAFWSDGATKQRWMALPDGATIAVQSDGDWTFPERSVLVKNFRIDDRVIETRLLMRHTDGSWGGFTYEWNADQTDATLVRGGAVRDIGNGRQWIFPSESQCLECHTAAAGRALGLETMQLNRTFTYPQTNRTANQLLSLSSIGVVTPAITTPQSEPVLPDPSDVSLALDARARAYLHTNCAQCHRPGGPTPSNMDLRFATALAATATCNVAPQSGDLGIGAGARLIAPGSATNSIIVNRSNRRDQHGMPPLGSGQVDTDGVALLTAWIDALTGC
jgi:uncharacterized repeat protein (TIGR03806 family)